MRITKTWDIDLLLRSYLFIPKSLFRKTVRRCGKAITGKTLDIGAGWKPFVSYFAHTEYITLDNSSECAPDVIGDVLRLPFADKTFDSIVCLEVLEHVPDTRLALAEMSRVLKGGGVLLLSAPMHWPLHYEPKDYFRFTKYGFYEILKNDFSVTRTEKIGGVFSFLGARIAEKSALALYRLFPFFPRKARYILGHIANIPLSLFFYAISLPLDLLFPEDAISWLVIARKHHAPNAAKAVSRASVRLPE